MFSKQIIGAGLVATILAAAPAAWADDQTTATPAPTTGAPAPTTGAPASTMTPAPTAAAPATDASGPATGANSFTESQAKGRIEKAGYSDVSALKQDDKGVWRGTANKDGKSTPVGLDFQGNVVAQ